MSSPTMRAGFGTLSYRSKIGFHFTLSKPYDAHNFLRIVVIIVSSQMVQLFSFLKKRIIAQLQCVITLRMYRVEELLSNGFANTRSTAERKMILPPDLI